MADIRFERRTTTDDGAGILSLRTGMLVVFVAWLLFVWYGTKMTIVQTQHTDLIRVAIWGVAIVFAGLLVTYTWTIAAAIIERERFRGTVERALKLADQALEEARRLDPDITRQ
jgi:hypothetical protein